MFFDGTDFGVARPIYKAYIENQDMSIFFAAGTNDARDVEDIVRLPWYRKDKVQWFGWEASASVHETAVARFTNDPEVQVGNRAISDKDGKIVHTQGGDGTLGIGHGGNKAERKTDLWEGSSREVTTMRFDTAIKEKNIKEVSYLLLDVEGHEEPAIKGMALETNALSFPVFQWELGVTWVDGRNDGKMTQLDMVRYLESLGYVHFLMGAELSREDAILVRTNAAFFEKAQCVSEGGSKPFVPGNVLAVQQSLLTQNTKPWLTAAIAKMVKRGNDVMPSGCSPIKPSLIIVLVAVLQAFI
jgi:FkbM family methyltransferase